MCDYCQIIVGPIIQFQSKFDVFLVATSQEAIGREYLVANLKRTYFFKKKVHRMKIIMKEYKKKRAMTAPQSQKSVEQRKDGADVVLPHVICNGRESETSSFSSAKALKVTSVLKISKRLYMHKVKKKKGWREGRLQYNKHVLRQ